MRNEEHRAEDFRRSEAWTPLSEFRYLEQAPPGSDFMFNANSFSGGERNRLFANLGGVDFATAALISGLDHKEDARSWAWIDLDGDGWLDVLLMGPQQPRFRVFRNRLSRWLPDHRSLRIHLEGGNASAEPSEEWSPRQPVGAVVTASWGERKRALLLSAGEGMAAQNQNMLHLGLGSHEGEVDLHVRWPSGRETRHSVSADEGVVHLREREEVAEP